MSNGRIVSVTDLNSLGGHYGVRFNALRWRALWGFNDRSRGTNPECWLGEPEEEIIKKDDALDGVVKSQSIHQYLPWLKLFIYKLSIDEYICTKQKWFEERNEWVFTSLCTAFISQQDRTQNRVEIPFSLWVVQKGLSVVEVPKTTLYKKAHL